MDCNLIALFYSPSRIAQAAKVARTVISEATPKRVVAVINGKAVDSIAVRRALRGAKELAIVEHDNSGQEFGGYQAGIDSLRGELPKHLIVMNDTVGSHDILTSSFISVFLEQLWQQSHGAAIGKIDMSHHRLELKGMKISRWLRTHFFGMDRRAIQILGGRLYHPAIDALITASPDIDSFFGNEVTGSLRQHIHDYVFAPSSYSWYKAAALSDRNCSAMAGKVRAILQEKYLSMLIDESGIGMSPVYLSSRQRFRHYLQKASGCLARSLAPG